jgi:hypothetical protein
LVLGASRRKAPGLTLLELAVSIAIGTMIMMILGGIFLAQGQYFAIEDAIAETQINAFNAVDTAGLYMTSAKRVMASQTINGTLYTTGDSLVVLELPSVNASGAIIAATYDYIAIGQDPTDATRFMFDIQKGTGSARINGKFVKARLVDKVIFRYNTVTTTSATAIDLYVRTTKNARGRAIYAPLGKVFYLGAT